MVLEEEEAVPGLMPGGDVDLEGEIESFEVHR